MTDQSDQEIYDPKAVRARFAGKVDSRKSARKARQKTLSNAADGRSLRETGRTEQMNIRVKPEIKKAIQEHVADGQRTLWLEEAIIEKLKAEGYEIDA